MMIDGVGLIREAKNPSSSHHLHARPWRGFYRSASLYQLWRLLLLFYRQPPLLLFSSKPSLSMDSYGAKSFRAVGDR
jgi:hypothetical protein